MRICIAAFLTVTLLVGTYYYTSFADSVRRAPPDIGFPMDAGAWRLEIDRTFDCIPDPDYATDSLSIQITGVDVFRSDQRIPMAEPVVIANISGIEQGVNELFVEANLRSLDEFNEENSEQKYAMRLKIFRGATLIADKTYWADGYESTIAETLRFDAPTNEEIGNDHDHAP